MDRQRNTSAFLKRGIFIFHRISLLNISVNIRLYAPKINSDLHKQVPILIICNNIYKVILIQTARHNF